MNEKFSLEYIFRGCSEKLRIKKTFAPIGLKKKVSDLNVRCYRRLSFSLKKNVIPTIVILTPQEVKRLSLINNDLCAKLLCHILFCNVVYLILARYKEVPTLFKTVAQTHSVYIAASELNEYYLESQIKGLIREKIKKIKTIHGVLLEDSGMGILITGTSGIGKTKSALNHVQQTGYWIADDLAVVRENKEGELIASGHAKIKKYLHHGKEGIIPVSSILESGKIKNKTKLAAIIEVERKGVKKYAIGKTKKKILSTILPCIKISIPIAGYFNKNLLEKSISIFKKDRE